MDGKHEKDHVRLARKKKGLKQREVAESLGISRSYYATIESGMRVPSLKVAIDISDFLNIDIKFFLS
ncbi:helix-turn-helix transcriptional regulator [Bacillus sp. BB56-3]|uniref:helix-turn-helix domain-containing protein n=1 Tax=Bacillus sp. BB56-3 TaxID=2217831 RepID=UPI0011EFBDD7|nr:helix-turn-helix transcriptional regulator [Bacillus sp. BB56-3]KAA0784328.1 XRE family transcriptional regulator [Bacillus sp. BB56-3]